MYKTVTYKSLTIDLEISWKSGSFALTKEKRRTNRATLFVIVVRVDLLNKAYVAAKDGIFNYFLKYLFAAISIGIRSAISKKVKNLTDKSVIKEGFGSLRKGCENK